MITKLKIFESLKTARKTYEDIVDDKLAW